MKFEGSEREDRRNFILETRDIYKKHANPLQKNVAEIQAAKHETAMYRLMTRSQENSELINAVNKFLTALDHRSSFGSEDQQLTKIEVERMTKFFEEKADELWFLGENRPS